MPSFAHRGTAVTAAAALACFMIGCGGGDDDSAPATPAAPVVSARTVYTMDNAATGNQVLAFRSADDGSLTPLGIYPTGGLGTGTTEVSAATPQDGVDVLASQGSLAMSDDKHFLLAVNAGSSSITSFRIAADGTLTRADTLPSGGLQPNAVSAVHGLVYVSNVGSSANGFSSGVSGFRIADDGRLSPIAGSAHALSTATAQPASINLNPAGNLLAVTELTSNTISVFPVNADGSLGTPVANPSAGAGPFGASFTSAGRLVVSDVMANALSTYAVDAAGSLTTLTAGVPNGQTATCWTLLSPDGLTAYTSNSGSGTLSSFNLASDGSASLRAAVASTLAGPASGNIDGGVSADGHYLYVMDGHLGMISALRVESDGTLTTLAGISGQGLPTLGGEGLVVR